MASVAWQEKCCKIKVLSYVCYIFYSLTYISSKSFIVIGHVRPNFDNYRKDMSDQNRDLSDILSYRPKIIISNIEVQSTSFFKYSRSRFLYNSKYLQETIYNAYNTLNTFPKNTRGSSDVDIT